METLERVHLHRPKQQPVPRDTLMGDMPSCAVPCIQSDESNTGCSRCVILISSTLDAPLPAAYDNFSHCIFAVRKAADALTCDIFSSDDACLCADIDFLQSSLTCAVKSCSGNDVQAVANTINTVCNAALNAPHDGTCMCNVTVNIRR